MITWLNVNSKFSDKSKLFSQYYTIHCVLRFALVHMFEIVRLVLHVNMNNAHWVYIIILANVLNIAISSCSFPHLHLFKLELHCICTFYFWLCELAVHYNRVDDIGKSKIKSISIYPFFAQLKFCYTFQFSITLRTLCRPFAFSCAFLCA